MSDKDPQPSQSEYDAKAGQKFIDAWFKADKEAATIMAEAMAKAKGKRDKQKEIIDDAEANGFPRKQFKATLKQLVLERKIDAIRDAMEPDDQDTLDQMQHALGLLADTPLGKAAVAASGLSQSSPSAGTA